MGTAECAVELRALGRRHPPGDDGAEHLFLRRKGRQRRAWLMRNSGGRGRPARGHTAAAMRSRNCPRGASQGIGRADWAACACSARAQRARAQAPGFLKQLLPGVPAVYVLLWWPLHDEGASLPAAARDAGTLRGGSAEGGQAAGAPAPGCARVVIGCCACADCVPPRTVRALAQWRVQPSHRQSLSVL